MSLTIKFLRIKSYSKRHRRQATRLLHVYKQTKTEYYIILTDGRDKLKIHQLKYYVYDIAKQIIFTVQN